MGEEVRMNLDLLIRLYDAASRMETQPATLEAIGSIILVEQSREEVD